MRNIVLSWLLLAWSGHALALSCIKSENPLEVDVADLFERADIVVSARATSREGGIPQEVSVEKIWKGSVGQTIFVEGWYPVRFAEAEIVFAVGPRDRGQYSSIDDCFFGATADVLEILGAGYDPKEPSARDDGGWFNTAWLLIAILVSAAGLWLWQLIRPSNAD